MPIDCVVTGRAHEVQSSQSPSWDGEGDPGWMGLEGLDWSKELTCLWKWRAQGKEGTKANCHYVGEVTWLRGSSPAAPSRMKGLKLPTQNDPLSFLLFPQGANCNSRGLGKFFRLHPVALPSCPVPSL